MSDRLDQQFVDAVLLATKYQAEAAHESKAAIALRAENGRLRELLKEACHLAMSFDVHGSQPGERARLADILREGSK